MNYADKHTTREEFIMRFKKTISIILALTAVMTTLASCGGLTNPAESEVSLINTQTPPPIVEPTDIDNSLTVMLGDNLPVSRALAAKMLTLAFSDKSDIDTLEREITFSDCDPSKWYDRYANAAVINGIMSGSDGIFMPEDPVLVYQAQLLLDKLDPENEIKMQVTDENRDKPISYALWTDLYIKLLKNLSENGDIYESFDIANASVVTLATPETNDSLTYDIITDVGSLCFGGFVMSGYLDRRIKILKKDGEILAILSIETIEPILMNVYVLSSGNGSLTIFTGGAERTYPCGDYLEEGSVADIKISDGSATIVAVYDVHVIETLKKSTPDFFEFSNSSLINIDKNFKVYSTADGAVKWKSLSDITVGTNIAEIFLNENGCAVAAVITEKSEPKTLRVVVQTSNYGGFIHNSVELTGTSNFTVKHENGEDHYSAGEVFAVGSNALLSSSRYYISCDSSDGRIVLKSVKRNWANEESPAYRGTMEIGVENGGWSIVNELSMEEYLYAVVPSEMPSSHGLEAAKAQAVTARSYAYSQFYANRYHKYGANVDDSVSCQVYNNIPENQLSIAAVNETKGQCLTYEGNVVSANFFSTSCGMTANSGEVWAGGAQFPTSTTSYLESAKQWSGEADYGDLSVEENAAKFFKSEDIESYDSEFSWFRWNVKMSLDELTASINAVLADRYAANPRLIKTLQPNGSYLSRPINSIGDLLKLEVVSRGEGGNIMQMLFVGTEATVLVSTEYNIRVLLSPVKRLDSSNNILVLRKGGTVVENYNIMPSAFFVMEQEESSITFYGGGNGHGVGMSQNGVMGMISVGFSFDEILAHYYNGTEIKVMIN